MAPNNRPQLPEIDLPDLPGLIGGWGRKLEITLLRFLLQLYNVVAGPLLEARETMLKFLFQSIEDELKPAILPLLDEFDAQDNLPAPLKRMSEHLRHSEPITFAAIGAAIIVSAIIAFAMGMIQPFQRLAMQKVNEVARPARLDAPAAFAAWARGAISEAEFKSQCRQLGWPDLAIDAFSEIFAQRVGVGDLSTLLLRGEMTESAFNAELSKRGYKPDEIAKLKELQKIIPGVGDIIRMAVREAWRDDVAARYGYDQDYPAELTKWAATQGLSEDWAKKYWRSHWQLPGPAMAQAMLWRTSMTDEDYGTLLRIADYPEAFRKWMSEVAYRTYTRVDVRRMHATGVLSEEDVYRNYLDLGYPREKARKMTEFTVAYNQQAERDLSRTDVLNGFKIGYFRQEEALALIIALGYSEQEADYYISKVLYDLWQDEIKEQVKYLRQQYVRSLISENDVYQALGRLNLPAEQINRYLRTWDIEKEAKVRLLTPATLDALRKAEIIDDGTYRDEMSALGYKKQYIDWLLELIRRGGES